MTIDQISSDEMEILAQLVLWMSPTLDQDWFEDVQTAHKAVRLFIEDKEYGLKATPTRPHVNWIHPPRGGA